MNNKNILDTSIEFIKGVGPSRAKLFKEELDITTYDDLLNFFPFRYIDRTNFYKIKDILINIIYFCDTIKQKKRSSKIKYALKTMVEFWIIIAKIIQS